MKPLSKSEYAKLSPSGKAAVKALVTGSGAYKARVTRPKAVTGRGAYKPLPRRVRGQGAYVPEKYSNKDLAKEAAGRAVGFVWDKLFGSGAYAPSGFAVKSNSFMNEITANGPPQVWATGAEAFTLRHREYLGEVTTSDVARQFNLNSYDINPGQSALLPWGSQIANQFQQYRPKGMLFEFISTSSDAIASSTDLALGTVIMATNYNSADAEFSSKQQMLQTEFCSQGKPSQCILHPIECKPSLTSIDTLYMRAGTVPSGQDQRLFDLGKFQIATQGFQGTNVVIGELWVTYEIELLKPIQSDGSSVLLGDFYQGTTGITTSKLLGTAPQLVSGSNAGTFYADNYIEFDAAAPGDVYLVLYTMAGTAGTVTGPVLSTSACQALQLFQHGSQTGTAGPQTGATASKVVTAFLVKINASFTPTSLPYATISYSALPSSPTSAELCVCKVNPNFPLSAVTMVAPEVSTDEFSAKLKAITIEEEVATFQPTPPVHSNQSVPPARQPGQPHSRK